MSDFQHLGASGLYGTLTTSGGGGTANLSARDSLDYLRQGSPGSTQAPWATHPDGYLATGPNGSRQDRLTQAVGDLNRRAYQRGVHKGERIDPGDYVWPSDQQPNRGLKALARGVRQAPTGLEPVHLVNGGAMQPLPQANEPTPEVNRSFKHLVPSWR